MLNTNDPRNERDEGGRTIWEKLGAAEGLWASILLGVQFVLLLRLTADPRGTDDAFASALQGERMMWEWITFLRIVAGLMIIWWMGSVMSRLRLAEGEPGRLATIMFGVGASWGLLWLVSALFNSLAILFVTDYANPGAGRMMGALSVETMYVLTPAIAVVLTFGVALVVLRFGGLPRWYGWACVGASALLLVLAVADWYGSGSLSLAIMGVALAWTALTSVLLIPTFRPPDLVSGTTGRVAA